MTEALAALAGLVVWGGASLVALAGSRVTECAGIITAAAGAAATLFLHGSHEAAAILLAGGAAAAVVTAAARPPSWSLLPPGSAPVLTLCVVMLALAAWAGSVLIIGPHGVAESISALVLLGIGTARVVSGRLATTVGPAAALVALGIGMGAAPTEGVLVGAAAGAAVLATAAGRLPAPA